jgi:hypothetical protein
MDVTSVLCASTMQTATSVIPDMYLRGTQFKSHPGYYIYDLIQIFCGLFSPFHTNVRIWPRNRHLKPLITHCTLSLSHLIQHHITTEVGTVALNNQKINQSCAVSLKCKEVIPK